MISDSFSVIKLDRDGDIKKLVGNIEKIINMFPDDAKLVFGLGRDYTKEDLRKNHEMVVQTIEIVTNAIKAGKNTADIKKDDILRDWEPWSDTVFKGVNSDMWIDTIYKSITQK